MLNSAGVRIGPRADVEAAGDLDHVGEVGRSGGADQIDDHDVERPFRIRRAVAGDTIEETTFDRVNINVKIDPKKFEAPK